MRKKVSDYIADFFVDNNIRTVFTVVGGGAMHLNDSLGHHPGIHCVYNHHEQASSIAAEAYFRVNNELAGLCVTSGPGAINALNGVVGAYQDSIPMMVVSGQCKTTLTNRFYGLNLRTLGNQEFDIVSTLSNATKYAVMLTDAREIKYQLEKALYIAKEGRPGPVWLDIPLDIQGAYIETDELVSLDISKETIIDVVKQDSYNSKVCRDKIKVVLEHFKKASRPVFYAGNGIRISGGVNTFRKLIELTKIPVVTCWDSVDLIETEHNNYCGRAGIMGDRPGNFAVQNSDLLICVGTRLNIYQVGYQLDSWARESYVVDVDIDSTELSKPTIRVDLPICCDADYFMELFIDEFQNNSINVTNDSWIAQCARWKEKYPVVQEKHYALSKPLNVYAFVDILSRELDEGAFTVVANGSASVVGSAAYFIKRDSRFIMNCGLSSMGYDLPAAVGVASALNRANMTNRQLVCIAGDGSIMMNLQELQTIVTNQLPIKIIIINNNGYQQIRITQTNLFNKQFVGLGPDSHDLGFPNFEKLAAAFDIPYYKCDERDKMKLVIKDFLSEDKYSLLEVFCSTDQFFEPKSATKRLEDGSLFSPPLEDLAPFLSKDELESNMYIKTLG